MVGRSSRSGALARRSCRGLALSPKLGVTCRAGRLTLPSSGRLPARFARFQPPLMSNVRPSSCRRYTYRTTFERLGATERTVMHVQASAVSVALVLALACMSSVAHTEDPEFEASRSSEASATSKSQPQAVPPKDSGRATRIRSRASLPCQAFTHPPEKAHDPTALLFTFDQLDHWYRVPGEFTHRLDGDLYGFETLSFIISETHPGGGPGLHVHDTEEAHVLLQGSAQYQIGDKMFIVQAPYVAKVPAGVPHTFINVGTEPFNLVAVFATKHPNTTRVGPNPLIPAWERQHGLLPAVQRSDSSANARRAQPLHRADVFQRASHASSRRSCQTLGAKTRQPKSSWERICAPMRRSFGGIQRRAASALPCSPMTSSTQPSRSRRTTGRTLWRLCGTKKMRVPRDDFGRSHYPETDSSTHQHNLLRVGHNKEKWNGFL